MKVDTLKDEESSLPGAFPGLIKPTHSSHTDIIVVPTITVTALTSILLTILTRQIWWYWVSAEVPEVLQVLGLLVPSSIKLYIYRNSYYL